MPEGAELIVAVAAAGSALVWVLSAGLLYLSRRPVQPEVGPRTLDLPREPPAVANFLVNDFRVTSEAVPATLLDLAARGVLELEQRGPGVFYVRLRRETHEALAPYEEQVLAHLRALAHDGVVPADALTTGPQETSRRWWRRFEQAVTADAKARGLSVDALGGGAFTVLSAAALVPGVLAWIVSGFQPGALVVFAAWAILGWIRARHPQRETPEGLAAASRWLGVRAELAENEVFPTYTPLTVALWDRLLAYGAALGVAPGASGSLPMGAESDTSVWSAYGGRWRHVRISYPRLWPPAWGADPLRALAVGLVSAAGGAGFLYLTGAAFLDAGLFGVAPLAVVGIPVILGVAVVVMALGDWGTVREFTGPILRLRSFGEDEKRRYYVAVDDGASPAIRAFKVGARLYQGLEQGDLVTVRSTANLRCVRWIVPAPEANYTRPP